MTEKIITITAAAAEHIQHQLEYNQAKSNFRLGVKRTGCSGWMYTPELINDPDSDDEMITEINNIKIFVNKNHFDMLKGTVVDYVDRGLGLKELQFKNPNAQTLCGCGESFTLNGDNEDE